VTSTYKLHPQNLKILDYFANFQVREMKKLVEEGKVKH
jgi:hypothetical protein